MSLYRLLDIIFQALLILILSTSLVVAGVSEDIAAGKSLEQVFVNNVNRGTKVEDVMRQAMRVLKSRKPQVLAAALMTQPSAAPSLVEIALANGLAPEEVMQMALRVAPKYADEILRMGISANEEAAPDLLKQAIRAGIAPNVITPLINEFVLKSMQGLDGLSEQDKRIRMLTAEEILSTQYDLPTDMQRPVPVMDIPPRNGGSDRLASPN
ncbi:MAG: hypothetical protein OEZ43_05070 [Gammaproteobacteria bacterium]|nr:hypothetical protein [Gammaproteobacteria bacterium]